MKWQDAAIIIAAISALLFFVLGRGPSSDNCTPGGPQSQICKQSSVAKP